MPEERLERAPRVGLVTPVKDEIESLPRLVAAIEAQSLTPWAWVLVENASVDGSREFLESLQVVRGVERLHVEPFALPQERYELGVKYARVVNHGFETLERLGLLRQLDFVGILDADCEPEPDYYAKLERAMRENPRLGLTSGRLTLADGSGDGAASDWVRGNCRIWRLSCFLEAGYPIGPSADALSATKAALRGWTALPVLDALCVARDVGGKSDYAYYGYAAYFMGCSPLHAVLRAGKHVARGELTKARRFMSGYASHYMRGRERIADEEILQFNSTALQRKMAQLGRRIFA